jgi:hypothetical protein
MKPPPQVLSQLSPDTMRDALQRLLPQPPTQRFTVVTMTPKPPGPLLAAALRLRATWGAVADALGGDGRAAAAVAGLAAAVGLAFSLWRRRQQQG